MKIKSIYIDGLHNAKEKTYTFGDIVYIFGHNGAGKSTILQAIQLALLGYIPGTAKNSREAFLRHSPSNKIEVKLSLKDDANADVLITRLITPKENTLNVLPEGYDIAPIVKDIELPIFNFNEFVGQTANKLKEYFIKNILPTTDGKLDWETILTESILDCNFQDRDEIIQYGLSLVQDLDGEVLDQVIAANEKFKAEQSFNKTELQRLQNTIDSLIYYDDYVGPNNLDELISKHTAVTAMRDQLIKYETTSKSMQTAQEEVTHVKEQIAALGGRSLYDSMAKLYPQLKEQHTKLVADISAKKAEIAALRSKINSTESLIKSEGICTYTKAPCKAIVSKIDTLRNGLVDKKAEVAELEAQLENITSDYNTCVASMADCEKTIRQFNTFWDKLLTLQTALKEIPQKPDTDKTLTNLNAELEQIEQSKIKLMANLKYNETIENITKMKFEAELRGKALANWVKKTDTNGLQTTLMVKPFEDLADIMTNYITSMYGNEDLKAHFNVSTKANSFNFGLIRNGIYIPYDLLSSGEKCLYSLALMICIVNSSKSPLKVMLCDDMFDHLDNKAMENTFEALKIYNQVSENKIQFIFAGVKECKNAEDVLLRIG